MKVLHLPALVGGKIRHHFYLDDHANGNLVAYVNPDGSLARTVGEGTATLSCDPNTPERLAVAMAAFAQIYPGTTAPPPERWLPGGLVVETHAPPWSIDEFARIAAERQRLNDAEKALRKQLESHAWMEVP